MFVFLFYKSTTVVIVSLPFTVLNEELQTPVYAAYNNGHLAGLTIERSAI